jgi:hypothetical protein
MWSSLEIAKLAVAASIPLAVIGLGWWITLLTKRLEHSQWVNQKLVEKRIEIAEELAPTLNDLYCYFRWVGGWKDLSPTDVVDRKRRLDRTVHVNLPFMSPACAVAYDKFMSTLFATYAGAGQDAKLRTTLTSIWGDRRADYRGATAWNSDWDCMLTDRAADRDELRARYTALMSELARQTGVDTRKRGT